MIAGSILGEESAGQTAKSSAMVQCYGNADRGVPGPRRSIGLAIQSLDCIQLHAYGCVSRPDFTAQKRVKHLATVIRN
jgi:hypothetical protein